jgi:hypothetical protein
MASCYGCNADLPKGVPVIRRRVRTGGSSGVSWGKRVRVSSRSTYAERAFCQACIAAMDEKARQARQFRPFTKVGGAIAGFLLVVGMVGTAFDKKEAPATVASSAPAVASAPVVPDMALAVKKPKRKKRPKTAVAVAPSEDNSVLPMKNDDEPYELVK